MLSSVLSGIGRPIIWGCSRAYHHPIPTTSLVAGFASYYLRQWSPDYLPQWSPEISACIGVITFATLEIAKFTLCRSTKKTKELTDETIALQKMRNYLSQSYEEIEPILNGYTKDADNKKIETDKYGKKNQDFKTCCKTLGVHWASMRSAWSNKEDNTKETRWKDFLWKVDKVNRIRYVEKYGE